MMKLGVSLPCLAAVLVSAAGCVDGAPPANPAPAPAPPRHPAPEIRVQTYLSPEANAQIESVVTRLVTPDGETSWDCEEHQRGTHLEAIDRRGGARPVALRARRGATDHGRRNLSPDHHRRATWPVSTTRRRSGRGDPRIALHSCATIDTHQRSAPAKLDEIHQGTQGALTPPPDADTPPHADGQHDCARRSRAETDTVVTIERAFLSNPSAHLAPRRLSSRFVSPSGERAPIRPDPRSRPRRTS